MAANLVVDVVDEVEPVDWGVAGLVDRCNHLGGGGGGNEWVRLSAASNNGMSSCRPFIGARSPQSVTWEAAGVRIRIATIDGDGATGA